MRRQEQTNRDTAWRSSGGAEWTVPGRVGAQPSLQKRPSAERVAVKLGSLGVATALVALVILSGCVRVAPHQRGRLAHPTMEAGAYKSKGAGHVYAIGEGAMGGEVGAAAGCGCN